MSTCSDRSEGRRRDAARIVENGALGFARAGLPRPHYVKFSRLAHPDDGGEARFLEVTFSPEFVEIDGQLTDVLIEWDSQPALVAWVERLLVELDIELAPVPGRGDCEG